MKFPERRPNTITRANIAVALMNDDEGKLASAEALAAYFCGVGPGGNTYAEQRHVDRCRRLLIGTPSATQSKKGKPDGTED